MGMALNLSYTVSEIYHQKVVIAATESFDSRQFSTNLMQSTSSLNLGSSARSSLENCDASLAEAADHISSREVQSFGSKNQVEDPNLLHSQMLNGKKHHTIVFNGNGTMSRSAKQVEALISENEEESEITSKQWEFVEDALKDYGVDEKDKNTADSWIPRHPEMVRLTGRHPFNSEPPLSRLMRHGFLTPPSLHYVRNHGYVPHGQWDDWEVEISGLVKQPMKLNMEDLLKLPARELPVTLVCAGNRRKEQNMVRKSIGFNWGAAAVGTSLWRGARLCDVLRKCNILSKKKGALYVCFEGSETLPGGGGSSYGTSISVDIALDESRDVLLAYMQNGKLLEPDHGFPVRMIIPGFIGGRMVKWLKKIKVTSQESDNHYHYKDNRVLPSHVDAEKANAEGWWYNPDYIINELNVNSVITTPAHGEMLSISEIIIQAPYRIKGYAYSGGGRKVIRVEVTLDGGKSWKLCEIHHTEKPTDYGKYWCWCFWEVKVEVMELLRSQFVAVRAWDAAMNTQPQDLIWNVMGMMNNCWFKVEVSTCKPKEGGLDDLIFKHPTRLGNESGGWMAKQQEDEQIQTHSNTTLVKSASAPCPKLETRILSMSEVGEHNTPESPWIVVHGYVYDCTSFLKDHPGGADSILLNAGTDSTEEFDAIHSDKAKVLLEDYKIGKLDVQFKTPNSSMNGTSTLISTKTLVPAGGVLSNNLKPIALNPKGKITCKLIHRKELTDDLRLFQFSLPSEDHVLGLPVGKHIFVSASIDGKLCMRPYTPTSSDDDAVGYFELLVRVYFKDVNSDFPKGGRMSQHLNNLQIGQHIDVKGPLGDIHYLGKGNFTVHGEVKSAMKISMIAGGTGITPMYQVIKAILKDAEDCTKVHLIYANRTEKDIMLKSELEQWQNHHQNFKVWYVLSKSCEKNWPYSKGYVNEQLMRTHLPVASSDTIAFICGPRAMIELACLPNLEKLGYPRSHCFVF